MTLELLNFKEDKYILDYQNKYFQKFLKKMKKFPNILQLNYIYALLKEENIRKAEQIYQYFESLESTYPTKQELILEKELIKQANDKYEKEAMQSNKI